MQIYGYFADLFIVSDPLSDSVDIVTEHAAAEFL